jgi:Flp pilus assembly protein TadD
MAGGPAGIACGALSGHLVATIGDRRRPLRFNPSVVTSTREREALDQAIVRGSELLKQGKLEQAQRAYQHALELDPENTKVLALLGLSYFRANKFDDARPIYEDLVQRAPTDASHRLNLGLVYLKLAQGDLAIAALEASRALDPS